MPAKARPSDAELAQRNAEHVPQYWMPLTPFEAHDLAEGRVPDQVQNMARWLDTDSPKEA